MRFKSIGMKQRQQQCDSKCTRSYSCKGVAGQGEAEQGDYRNQALTTKCRMESGKPKLQRGTEVWELGYVLESLKQ